MFFNKSVVLSLFLTLLLSACSGSDGFGLGNGGDTTSGDSGNTGSSGSTETAVGTVKIGNGTGAGFVTGVLATSSSSIAAGASTTISVNLVDSNNAPVVDVVSVTFASGCTSTGLASFNAASASTSGGLASVIYTAAGCSGADAVTATASVVNADGVSTSIVAGVTLTIAADTVLALQHVSNSEADLSIKGTGGVELSLITFKLIGALGAPIIGETIDFSIAPSTGGVSLASGTASDVSDVNGEVTTILQTGTSAGTFTVVATHAATGVGGVSDGISISTGIPTADRFSLSVSDFAPADAFDTDGIEVEFSIIASDQFGNPLPDGTNVSFVSPEIGQIANSCQIADGGCSVTWRSADVRPADGRVSVIAFMNGSEQFNDTNGNNIFDTGDVGGFVDIGELCVDTDSSGTCDPLTGDFFLDSNLNGLADGADGNWNGPCLSALNDEPILATLNETAVCSAQESVTISQAATIFMSTNTAQIISTGTFPAFGTTITLNDDTGTDLTAATSGDGDTTNDIHEFTGMIIGDSNGNPLPTGTKITFTDPDGAFNFNGSSTITMNKQAPTGPFGVSIITNGIATPGGGRLIMTVDFPNENGNDEEFKWTTID